VVGLAIVPGVGGNDGVGLGGVVTLAGFRRVQSDASANAAAISLRADAGPGAERRIAHRIGTQAGPEDTPSAVANVGRVRGVPSVLAVLLGLLVLTTMLHALVVSIRSRRVDLAILKGLGANRRWIGRVVHSQATLLVVVPLLIGLPIGLLLGSRVFRAFVGRIGAWPDAVIPGLAMVAIALGLLLLANVAALVPARRARRLPTATMLRAE
jgi:putative ABC transport system permease protein